MKIASKAFKMINPLNIIKPFIGGISTGRSEAKRAEAAMAGERQAAIQERASIADERRKELMKANKIKIRALRSKRGAAYFEEGGRETIG